MLVAVASGKGGVGKTTVAINLALANNIAIYDCEVYNAIAVLSSNILFFKELCSGCGGCKIVCPYDAIEEGKRKIGEIYYGKKDVEIYQGLLNIGEARATPVIAKLKKYVKNNSILDAPPGNGCPMIETVCDTDFVILVTEPTPFGLHDLKIAVNIVRKFNINFGIIINKCGIGEKVVEKYCKNENIEILMKIPYNKEIA